jgi:hypothetical protein
MNLASTTQTAVADYRDDLIDAVTAQLDLGDASGLLILYDGTQPVDADTAVTTQTVLASLELDDPAFAAASAGTAVLASLPRTTEASASGTATWARIYDSDMVAIMDISVGGAGSGAELILDNTTVTAGYDVTITALSVTA